MPLCRGYAAPRYRPLGTLSLFESLNLWGCEPFSVFCLSAFLSFARLSTCGTRQNKLSLLSGGAEAGLKMLELAERHQLTARRMHDARHAALAMVAGVCAVYTYDPEDWRRFAPALQIAGWRHEN